MGKYPSQKTDPNFDLDLLRSDSWSSRKESFRGKAETDQENNTKLRRTIACRLF